MLLFKESIWLPVLTMQLVVGKGYVFIEAFLCRWKEKIHDGSSVQKKVLSWQVVHFDSLRSYSDLAF